MKKKKIKTSSENFEPQAVESQIKEVHLKAHDEGLEATEEKSLAAISENKNFDEPSKEKGEDKEDED